MSDIGLIQMTRKRIKKSLTSMLCEPCFYCDGEGHLVSRKTICYTVYRELLRESRGSSAAKLTLRVNPEIADLLHGAENALLSSFENRSYKKVEIYPDSDYHLEQFEIFEVMKQD
jgi:ribonuclease G